MRRIRLKTAPAALFGAMLLVALVVFLPMRAALGWAGVGAEGFVARSVSGTITRQASRPTTAHPTTETTGSAAAPDPLAREKPTRTPQAAPATAATSSTTPTTALTTATPTTSAHTGAATTHGREPTTVPV